MRSVTSQSLTTRGSSERNSPPAENDWPFVICSSLASSIIRVSPHKSSLKHTINPCLSWNSWDEAQARVKEGLRINETVLFSFIRLFRLFRNLSYSFP